MPDKKTKNGFDIKNEMINNSKVFKNFNQEFIVTTADKVKLCLLKHKQALKAQIKWVAPLGIFIALLTTLLTSSFNNTLGQGPEFWKSLFIISTFVSFFWFIYELVKTIMINKKGEGKVENIIIELKKSSNKSEVKDNIDRSDSNDAFF